MRTADRASAGRPRLARRVRGATRLAFSAAPGASVILIASAVVEGLLPVVAAWGMKLLLDELTRGAAGSPQQVAVATAVIAVAGLMTGLRQSVHGYVGGRLRRAVRLLALDRLLRRVNTYPGLAPFESPDRLNRIRLAEQAGERVPEELVNAGLTTQRSIVSVAGFMVALLVIWPPIVALLAVAAAPTIAVQLRLGRRRARLTEGITPLLRRQFFFQSLLTDARAAKEVRLFGIGAYLHGRMLHELREAQDAETALDRRELRLELCLELLGSLVAAAGVAVAAYMALAGRLSVGDVTVFIAAVAGVHAQVGNTATSAALAYQGLLLFGHYQDLVDDASAAPASAARGTSGGAAAVAPLRRGIELRDVWFRYGEDQPWTLRGVDLIIPHGAAVGLVGRNGAGKSTLVKLICRMYEPTAGAIYWDGVDIRALPLEELRTRIGAVFQDFMTYDLTAAENIGVGRLRLLGDPDAVRAAAAWAGIDRELDALPAGYQTLLSREFGPDDENTAASLLSGGQWQRVALARAFLRADADLMILDEPSSGLDAEAEHEIHHRLAGLRHGRTSLLISHRLSAVRDADLIVVLDHGRVVERGTHDDLIADSGTYARLFRLQASGYQIIHSPGETALPR